MTAAYPTLGQLRQNMNMHMHMNEGLVNMNMHMNERPVLGAVVTLIATPDADEKLILEESVKDRFRLRKTVRDSQETAAQYARDFVNKQYKFLLEICLSEAKFKPCNLTVQHGDGSSTRVMVRYSTADEDRPVVPITEICVRIYVKLAENKILSIIHADDELYEHLESAPSNPCEIYITTSKQRDYSDAVIGTESRKKQNPYVILMTMNENSNVFISIQPNPSAKDIKKFCKFDQVQRSEGTDKAPPKSKQKIASKSKSKSASKAIQKAISESKPKKAKGSTKPTDVEKKEKPKASGTRRGGSKTESSSPAKEQSSTIGKKKSVAKSKPNTTESTTEKGSKKIQPDEALNVTKGESENDSSSPTGELSPKPPGKRKISISENGKTRKKAKKPKDPDAPTRPMGSYFLFCAEMREDFKKNNPGGKAPTAKEMGAAFKELNKTKKAALDRKAIVLKKEYDVKKAAYDMKKSENSEELEGGVTTKTPTTRIKKTRAKKDPNAPKRPPTHYLIYCEEFRGRVKAENPGADQKLLMKILAERYRKLSEEDSEHYKALAKNLKEKYVIDMQKYKENLSLEQALGD